jgi:hypothetical protein
MPMRKRKKEIEAVNIFLIFHFFSFVFTEILCSIFSNFSSKTEFFGELKRNRVGRENFMYYLLYRENRGVNDLMETLDNGLLIFEQTMWAIIL